MSKRDGGSQFIKHIKKKVITKIIGAVFGVPLFLILVYACVKAMIS